MYQTYNWGQIVTSPLEFFLAGLFFVIILLCSYFYQNLRVSSNSLYRYFTYGLLVKLIGSFLYYFIYAHYYNGGDTTNYFELVLVFQQVFVNSPTDFFDVFFDIPTKEHYSIFWKHQVWPFEEAYTVPTQMTVIKIATPFAIITNGSFLLTTMFMGFLSFFAVWDLFKSFTKICPNYKYNFVACFLIPSSFFWAGGISKDTVTLIGVCLFVSNSILFKTSVNNFQKIFHILKISAGFLLVILVKPYVLIGLIPAFTIWQFSDKIKKTFSQLWLRSIILIFTTAGALLVSFFLLSLVGETMEKFAVDKALETAVVYNKDLQSDYHQGQSFNIGTFEPTIPSVMSKIPIAAFAGIFYPLPSQVSGLIPNISTIEGIFYLLTIFYLVFMRYVLRIRYHIPVEKKEILNFFIIFSIMFCIMLGLSTSNFGALVRFRVPILPFLSGFFLIHIYYAKEQVKKSIKFK
jgi:hypothetical protein